jgi:hypothetical protein
VQRAACDWKVFKDQLFTTGASAFTGGGKRAETISCLTVRHLGSLLQRKKISPLMNPDDTDKNKMYCQKAQSLTFILPSVLSVQISGKFNFWASRLSHNLLGFGD